MVDRKVRAELLQMAHNCDTLYLEVYPMKLDEESGGYLLATQAESENTGIVWDAALRSGDCECEDTFYDFDNIKQGSVDRVIMQICNIFNCDEECVFWC